ncbi:MAG: FkbM family methyltransferase [Pseudomonadota bacterium]
MTKTANTDTEAVLVEAEPIAPQSATPAPNVPTPQFGAYGPGLMSRLGLAVGRLLPRGEAGLRLAGAVRPLALLGARHGVSDVSALGLKLRLHPKDNLSEKRLFLTPQCFDPDELETLSAAMSPGRTFFDIGANAGAYALVAAKAGGPTSRVIAVEPQVEMRRRIAFNARENALSNIEITGVALSDYEGESVMRIVDTNMGRAALPANGAQARAGSGEAVRVTTLLKLMDELGVDRIDAAKIDVEGGEAAILSAFFRDAAEARWPGLLILERPQVNETGGDDPVALALQRGYRLTRTTRMNAILERA